MSETIDAIDRTILGILQQDASLSVDVLAERSGLSRNATWRRVKRLEDRGIITGRVALLDPARVGLPLIVLMAVRTRRHDATWAKDFRTALAAFPEITAAWRTSGDVDYMLQARVADVAAYDRLYQRLIARIDLDDVSASFVMEELKATTALPLR